MFKEKEIKKIVSVRVKPIDIERVDQFIKAYRKENPNIPVSRSDVINKALEIFLDENER